MSTSRTLSAQTRDFTVLFTFNGGTGGALPHASPLVDRLGNVYGTTSYAGIPNSTACSSDGCGVLFKLSPEGVQTLLYTFTGLADGGFPAGSLVRDAEGNMYGLTYQGGDLTQCLPGGCGTVFKLDATGGETTLFDSPFFFPSNVIRDPAGSFYGTATENNGEIFQITPDGVASVLHTFTGPPTDGEYPGSSLVRDRAGNLYGVTREGGEFSAGTVFKLDTAGNETILYSFTGGSDGGFPDTPLILDQSGNLYGEAGEGEPVGGVIFKVSPSGAETVLYNFSGGTDGDGPFGGLARDLAGNLYGTAYSGGASGGGVLFKVEPGGKETVLFNFTDRSDGMLPENGVVLGRMPYGLGYALYGTTTIGGDMTCAFEPGGGPGEGCGVVFRFALPPDVQADSSNDPY